MYIRFVKLFGNKNQVNNQQNTDVRYKRKYYKTQEETKVRAARETICPYCGTSNNPTREFCISCDSKLEN